jgi:hypothetical protein
MKGYYHYTESGLDNVWLAPSGVKRRTFGEYGEAIAIHDEEALWNLIGRSIANQDSRIVGQELKFLRTLLDWTQTNLGKRLGYIDGQIVAKWEKARHTPVPVAADTFIRAAYREKIGERPMVTKISNRLQEIIEIKMLVIKHDRYLEEGPMGEWMPKHLPAEMSPA